MQFDHFNLEVPADQLERVKDFYHAVFGWQPGFRPEFHRPGYWLYQDGQPLLHLVVSRDGLSSSADQGTGVFNHLAFRCQDLSAISARLASLKIACERRELPALATTQLFFRDPLGLRIEINGPLL